WASPAPSGSELRTGRAEVDERPDLDGAQRGEGDTRSDPHRLAEIARLDHDHAAERLLGLHERTVGRRYLAVADLHGRGRRRELESDGRHQVTAGLQLAVVGPDGAENRLALRALIEDLPRVEVDQARIAHGGTPRGVV